MSLSRTGHPMAGLLEFTSEALREAQAGNWSAERCFEHFVARAGLQAGSRAYNLARVWACAQTDPLAIAIIVRMFAREAGNMPHAQESRSAATRPIEVKHAL
ncbi:MAG TPA: hypothetical protein V6D47_00130 [Oscillatoriaceae cyanobacterium]